MKTITEQDFQREFLIHKELSSGKQDKTFTAMIDCPNNTPITLVLKEMNEKRAAVYQALCNMWNPHIAETYDVIKVEDRYIAVTEYICARGSEKETLTLSEYVNQQGALDKQTALSVCIEICEGLEEFHNQGFVHRDLKPDNIMISDCTSDIPKIKIVDFGGAKAVNMRNIPDTTVVGTLGTLGYQAPETISSSATNLSDIYSVGCILSFLLTGQEPGLVQYSGDHYIAAIIETITTIFLLTLLFVVALLELLLFILLLLILLLIFLLLLISSLLISLLLISLLLILLLIEVSALMSLLFSLLLSFSSINFSNLYLLN